MRRFLHGGPVDPSLVDPIVDFVYFSQEVNRCFLEDHLAALERSRMLVQRMKLNWRMKFMPELDTYRQLREKYGTKHDFSISRVEATLRKPGGSAGVGIVKFKKILNDLEQLREEMFYSLRPHPRWFTPLRRKLEGYCPESGGNGKTQ
jgi:hypothetical protein